MSCVETRNITVRAERDSTKPNGFGFTMVENGTVIADDTIHAAKGGGDKNSDYHTFIFTLENGAGSNLEFLDHPFDVMWVAPGNASQAPQCPPRRSSDADFNIGAIEPRRLVVHNANSRPCKHKFVLNFVGTKADGTRGIVPYDPIWGNTNGGSK